MGLTSSREATATQSPTHIADSDLVLTSNNVGTANLAPVTTIKTATSPSKQYSWKTNQQQQNHHVRQASVRSRAAQPMPDHSELDKRFAKVLVSQSAFIFVVVAALIRV